MSNQVTDKTAAAAVAEGSDTTAINVKPVGLPDNLTKEDLKEVCLYQMKPSPPCAKIRAILQYHGVPFKQINGKKPNDEYTKVPVLMMNGYQINDSFQMVIDLAPILHGAKLSEEDIAFEKQMAYGMQIACVQNNLENGWNMRRTVQKWMGCCAANCLTVCCCNCPCYRNHALGQMKKAGVKVQPTDIFKYLTVVEERLGDNPYLAGDKLGILDLSLYGVTHTFSSKPAHGFFQEMLDKSEKFSKWWMRMYEAVGVVN